MIKRVGLIAGRERSFGTALLERAAREPAIEAGWVEIGGTLERHIERFDAIVDRLSPRVPHFRAYLKSAALAGATVLNDPFRASAADRFFALSLGARLGLQVPRTVLLPQKRYSGELAPEHDLGNLQFPLQWHELAHYVGFPAELRTISGGSAFSLVRDLPGMLATFDGSGEGVLMMQRAVSGLAVRAVSVGDEVILLERDPTRACYRDHAAEDWLPVAVADEVRRSARTMAHALGYDLCAVDMVVGEERVWLVEADNPLPALEREVIGSVAFERIVAAAVRLVVRAARASERTADRQPWAQLVGASGP